MGFDDTWADANPDGNEDNAPPDGLVDAALVDAGAFTSKAGDDFVRFEWQSVDKEYQWTQLNGFKSLKAAGFTKGQCMKLGVDVESVLSLEEIDTAVKEHISQFYEVEIERNTGNDGKVYVNTYIRDGQATPDVPADTRFTPAAAGGDDDIPF
jgi:hypothetical protein